MASFQERLDPANRFAWKTYRTACTRLASDGQVLGEVLRRLMAPLDDEAFEECWVRLNVLHDILSPPTPTK